MQPSSAPSACPRSPAAPAAVSQEHPASTLTTTGKLIATLTDPQPRASTRSHSGQTASSPSATVTAAPTCGTSLTARVCQLSDTLVTRRNNTGTPGPRLRRNTRSPSRDGDPVRQPSEIRSVRRERRGFLRRVPPQLDHHVPSSGDPGRARALPAYTRAPDMPAHSPQPWRRHKSTRYALLDG
jgi:hypothetical protein